jgi:hypothetical protein
MSDLKSPRLLYFKAALFVSVGTVAIGLILLNNPDWRLAALLGLAIWAFCRAYYFAIYVVEHYVDSEYRFAGLIDFARYLCSDRKRHASEHEVVDE